MQRRRLLAARCSKRSRTDAGRRAAELAPNDQSGPRSAGIRARHGNAVRARVLPPVRVRRGCALLADRARPGCGDPSNAEGRRRFREFSAKVGLLKRRVRRCVTLGNDRRLRDARHDPEGVGAVRHTCGSAPKIGCNAAAHRRVASAGATFGQISIWQRRGFVFQSSEIYGGTGSVWDYGPLGVELKKNIKDAWWNGDGAVARRHRGPRRGDHHAPQGLGGQRPRQRLHRPAGGLQERARPASRRPARDAACPRKPSKKPGEHADCQLTEPRQFNLMFKTFMGRWRTRRR